MSFDALGDLDWLGVVLGTLAYFMLGAIWYSPPVFGKPWMAASGMEMSETQEGPPPTIYIAPFLFSLVATIATAMLAEATGSETFSEGLSLGLVVGVGYAGTIVGVTSMFESKKPNRVVWGLITAGYHVLGLMLSAIIVTVMG